jgi:hypothetical protein
LPENCSGETGYPQKADLYLTSEGDYRRFLYLVDLITESKYAVMSGPTKQTLPEIKQPTT